jgi:hypothetical protein
MLCADAAQPQERVRRGNPVRLLQNLKVRDANFLQRRPQPSPAASGRQEEVQVHRLIRSYPAIVRV